jgi:hypothetical protein
MLGLLEANWEEKGEKDEAQRHLEYLTCDSEQRTLSDFID